MQPADGPSVAGHSAGDRDSDLATHSDHDPDLQKKLTSVRAVQIPSASMSKRAAAAPEYCC